MIFLISNGMDLKSKIREVPNWPKEGVNFKDITTILEDKDVFKYVIDSLTEFCKNVGAEKIVGIDSRGFLVAAPVAYNMNVGLSIVRKPGKLPFTTIEQEYTLEYASNVIQMHNDTIKPGEKVVLLDDLMATGGTAEAACDLIEKLGGKIMGVGVIIDLPFLGGSQKLKDRGCDVKSLVQYDEE